MFGIRKTDALVAHAKQRAAAAAPHPDALITSAGTGQGDRTMQKYS
jgi:hypothetical protein